MRAILALGMLLAAAIPTSAQPALKIFDAHLHYNQEPNPYFSLDQVLETFRRNGIGGILANSRPNKGTHQLVDAGAHSASTQSECAPDSPNCACPSRKTGSHFSGTCAKPGVWVVPFIRPYRTRDDVQNWSRDPAINELIESEYKRGYFVGVGEFHIYGPAAERPVVKRAVDFAAERDLYILAHCDEQALLILHRHNPKAKIIWAHTGFSTPVERVRELLETYPALMAELSYRGGIVDGAGQLAPGWRELFARHSDRFLLGSDTWIPERWASYGEIIAGYRGWLAQLPPEQARRIAHGNAERLFKARMPE